TGRRSCATVGSGRGCGSTGTSPAFSCRTWSRPTTSSGSRNTSSACAPTPSQSPPTDRRAGAQGRVLELPVEDRGVGQRDSRLEALQAVPSLPVVPGQTIRSLLAPLHLPGPFGRGGLQDEPGLPDAPQLPNVTLLALAGGQVDEVPASHDEIELMVRKFLEGAGFQHVGLEQVRGPRPWALRGLSGGRPIEVEA